MRKTFLFFFRDILDVFPFNSYCMHWFNEKFKIVHFFHGCEDIFPLNISCMANGKLKFLYSIHVNYKTFPLRFHCIWNSGNWIFAHLHVFFKNSSCMWSSKNKYPLYLSYFSLILILILRNFFIYTSFWKSLLTRFVFYESRHAVSAASQIHCLPYSHYFHSSNFFFTKL